MTMENWACAGGGEPHPVALEHLELLRNRGSNSVAIERCGACGTLYRHLSYEVNDWGPNGDYYSLTEIWTPLTADDVDRLRADPGWQPDVEPAHRWDSGWRAS